LFILFPQIRNRKTVLLRFTIYDLRSYFPANPLRSHASLCTVAFNVILHPRWFLTADHQLHVEIINESFFLDNATPRLFCGLAF